MCCGKLFLRGTLLCVRFLQTRAGPFPELCQVLPQLRYVLRLLGEERLELALLVVPTLAQDGELLLRVFQPLARLLCAVLALSGPLERGVSLSFCLFQLRGALFSRCVELGA